MDKWPHLGPIVSLTVDDEADITSKRSTLCQQINNVLCFFASRDPITRFMVFKTSLALYILWDLTNASIRDMCMVRSSVKG